MRKAYNKLVRDKIPDRLRHQKIAFDIRRAHNQEMKRLLYSKFTEEIQELLLSENNQDALGELADIYEVAVAYAHAMGFTEDDLYQVREYTLSERGGFYDQTVLLWTEEKE